MERRVVLVVLAGLMLTVLLVSVATAGEVRLWHEAPAGKPSSGTIPTETLPEATLASLPPLENEPSKLPAWIGVVVEILLLGVAVALIVAALVVAWRHRPRMLWRRDTTSDDFAVLPDIARSMSQDAADQRATLLRGSPRNAIVECWLRLEAVVAGAGMVRDPADTSTEFTSRVLAAYSIDRSAILELSALYREARFSTHDMGESERTAAVDALDALHDGLRDHLAADTEAVARADSEPVAG